MNVCVEKLYASLVYTEQVNNAFRALWIVNSGWLTTTIHLWAAGAWDFKISGRLSHIIKFWSANYWSFVVYTKTSIQLSVGESDGHIPPCLPKNEHNNSPKSIIVF